MGCLVVQWVDLRIGVLIQMVRRCLGIKSILVLVLVFDFLAVERFDGKYFEDGAAFGDGCFEEEKEFSRMLKHIGDFG